MSLPTSIEAPTRADWRQWLADNHATETNVWLKIYRKNGATPSVTYDEAVDEALCFGWIDSSNKKGDGQYYLQFFSRRHPKSNRSGDPVEPGQQRQGPEADGRRADDRCGAGPD